MILFRFQNFISCFLLILVSLYQSYAGNDLQGLTDKKWILTEMKYGGMEDNAMKYKNYYIIFHNNSEITFKLDSCLGRLKIETITGNRLHYKFIKSNELTYNGKLGEKVFLCLTRADYYYLRQDTLTLVSEHGYLQFLASPFKDSGLTGNWTLTAYKNAEAEELIKAPDKLKRPLTIHFNDDGEIGSIEGSTEANEFQGKFEIVDTTHVKITKFDQPLFREKNEWNEHFWEVIKFASAYIVKNETLLFYFFEDKDYMEFQRDEGDM